jgi:hypothetical protein
MQVACWYGIASQASLGATNRRANGLVFTAAVRHAAYSASGSVRYGSSMVPIIASIRSFRARMTSRMASAASAARAAGTPTSSATAFTLSCSSRTS